MLNLVVKTANLDYVGEDKLDITVGSGHGLGRKFAPTWTMVRGLKSGYYSWVQYEKMYYARMRMLWCHDRAAFGELWRLGEVTLCCYCRDKFCCHRTLLAYILSDIAGKYEDLSFQYVINTVEGD